jgi:DNA-binding Lrp family transcriptional regulator
MKNETDKKDLDILSCLRLNSREKLKKIAMSVKLPISTVYDRIKKMEKHGIIKKYSCIVEPKKLNHSIKTKIFFKVPNNLRKSFEEKESKNKVINSLLRISGNEWDYVAESFFQDIDHLYTYLEGINEDYEGSKNQVYYIINEIKQEGFLE